MASLDNIPDAPWIDYADTNGVPPDGYSEYQIRYQVETVETDGSTDMQIFDDKESALDFYQECVADGVVSVDCWSIDSDGNHIDLFACYEKEDEDGEVGEGRQ